MSFITEFAEGEFLSNYTAEELEAFLDGIMAITDSMRGSICGFFKQSAPRGFLACDGTSYMISDYQDLAELIKEQFGSYNYFGGDGVTTFAVPNLQGEFLRGAGTNGHSGQGDGAAVGGHQSSGLPGITGYIQDILVNNVNKAFYKSPWGWWSGGSGSGMRSAKIWLDASLYNSTYGAADHVRPTNTSVLWCIKY